MADEVQVVPVLNNRESLIQIQMPARKSKVGFLPGRTMNLVSGLNYPTVDEWTIAKENPTVQHMLTSKIEPSKAPEQNPERVGRFHLEEKTPTGATNPLAGLSDPEAIAAVAELLDMSVARSILGVEKRPKVVAKLKAHIDGIENAKEPKASK